MKRLELIEQLEDVQYNIENVEKDINQKKEDTTYFKLFGVASSRFEHNKEIRTKAYAYWKRRFNRILNELKY